MKAKKVYSIFKAQQLDSVNIVLKTLKFCMSSERGLKSSTEKQPSILVQIFEHIQ
jgi:hypothetical protein